MRLVKAIILASGTGLRFQDKQPKQFMKLAGLPVIVHTFKVFQTSQVIDSVVVVCHEDYIDHVWELVAQHKLSKVEKVVAGGPTRQESSRIGIESCGTNTGYVLLHDSVRPFLTHKVIEDVVDAVKKHGAVDTVIPSADTLVEIDQQDFISNIPDRSGFRRGQTPQAFDRKLVLDAHAKALADKVENATDDCQLVMRLGHRVYCVSGDEQNIKITYPIDLHLADKLFQLRQDLARAGEVEIASKLKGKCAVVFGGTDGIGLSFSNRLISTGAKVFALSRRSEPVVNITDPESVGRGLKWVVQQEGKVDFIVNCAGDLFRRNIEFMSPEQWRKLWAVNMDGSFNIASASIPLLRETKGCLLFVGSSSYTRGRGGYAAYSSSKAALVNFVQALAEELDPDHIRVNVVNPGRVRTNMRLRNFGQESPESLLEPDYVAGEMIKALLMDTSGSVFEVR